MHDVCAIIIGQSFLAFGVSWFMAGVMPWILLMRLVSIIDKRVPPSWLIPPSSPLFTR